MLEFDDKRHLVTFSGKSVQLQPLSYRLLEALAEVPEQVHSVADLTDKVWRSTQVSSETLKQRIFVLRKALNEAGIEGLSIQAVRGEGYRLLITPDETTIEPSVIEVNNQNAQGDILKRNVKSFILISVICTALLIFTTYWLFFRAPNHTINNRVLLWSNLPSEQMPIEGRIAFETWRSLVAEQSDKGQLQLVLSDRMDHMLVPVQARRDRAGLISNFELISIHDGHAARLSIVEPRTATVLRSDIIDLSSKQEIEQKFNAQFDALSNLIFSHRLWLTKEQRENPQAPIWQELRTIANQT